MNNDLFFIWLVGWFWNLFFFFTFFLWIYSLRLNCGNLELFKILGGYRISDDGRVLESERDKSRDNWSYVIVHFEEESQSSSGDEKTSELFDGLFVFQELILVEVKISTIENDGVESFSLSNALLDIRVWRRYNRIKFFVVFDFLGVLEMFLDDIHDPKRGRRKKKIYDRYYFECDFRDFFF